MARREVIEVTCDRCGRTEVQVKDEVSPPDNREFEGSLFTNSDGPQNLKNKVVFFDDLCKRCRRAVTNYFSKIHKVSEEEYVEQEEEPKAQVIGRS